jgi:hypothetical protein
MALESDALGESSARARARVQMSISRGPKGDRAIRRVGMARLVQLCCGVALMGF